MALDYQKLGLKCGIEIHTQPFSFFRKERKTLTKKKEKNSFWEIQ